MAEVFPPYDVFINHRGPDVKKTLASLIYRDLSEHGLRVFLDEPELQVGDSFPPAIESAICSASVQIAIFSERYAESVWCMDELLWMLDSHGNVIPIFYDIQPWELRHVGKGAFARALQDHRDKGRVTNQQVDRWITALHKVADISGVVFETEKDNYGDRLKQIVEKVLEKVGKKQLYVCDHPVGLLQAAANFEKEVLSPSGTHVVGIVGLGGSGKSTLVTHLHNSKCSQFKRSCFLSDVNKRDLPSLQQTLLRDLLRDPNLCVTDTRRGRTDLHDRLRGLTVLIVFEDIDSREQIENLLFVKNVVGNGSLILVTSRDRTLLHSPGVKIYDVKLLGAKDAQELFCWYAFGHTKPIHDLQYMVGELVRMCGGFPLALILLAEQLVNERDPRMWKKHLKSLSKRLPNEVSRQIIMDNYESLDFRERQAFLDVAHFLMGEDRDLVERVLDGLNDDGFQCLQMLHRKCLVVQSENRSVDIWKSAKGSFKIRMHDLVRDLARQIGRQELPLRLCCSNDKMICTRPRPSHYYGWLDRWKGAFQCTLKGFGDHVSTQKYDVRGIRRDEDHSLPEFLQNQDIHGLNILAVQTFTILQQFNRVSGELIWFRLSGSKNTLNPSASSWSSLRNIPSTLLLRSLRVLEVHGISPQDFCNLFDNCEPPLQLRSLEVACNRDFESASTAGPSTAIFTKHGLASQTSHSLQPSINLGPWFRAWLEKLNFKYLAKMVLQNIPGLKALPIKFEEVRNLTHVDLSGCSDLFSLPYSFTEELLQLQYLALRDCRNLVLRDLGKISTLEYLDFEGCSMLREMPKGTEVQKCLKHLNVLRTGLRKLPHNLEQLEDLEELFIGSSELTGMPYSLYNLSRLTDLTLLGCTNLHSIGNFIEKLERLESFRIYKCGMRALPETIAWMNLKILDVQECPLHLGQFLTGVDPGLMPLDSSHARRSIGQSTGCLTDLIIRDSHISEIDIPRHFPKLEIVDLSNNHLLTKIGRLPGNLIRLYLTNCSELTTLACFSNLARLEVLDISGCGELKTLNVEGLRSIQVIKANGCWNLRNFQGLDLLEKLSCFQMSSVLSGFDYKRYLRGCLLEGSEIPGGRILKELKYTKQASVEIKKCCFTDVRPNRAILLILLADPKCQIEVTFLGYSYTTYFCENYSENILMWSKDSEVFTDFKFSNDEAIHFNFNVLNSTSREQWGWIVEVSDEKVFQRIWSKQTK